jgi:hypothetical protein
VNTKSTGWVWQCKTPSQPRADDCSAECQSGIYSAKTHVCANVADDVCDNILGTQTPAQQSLYMVTKEADTGKNICTPKEGSIKYFKFQPDIAEAFCPAYWDTVLPDPSLGFETVCMLDGLIKIPDGANAEHAVVTSNPLPPAPSSKDWYLRQVGRWHTLTCFIRGNEDGEVRKTLSATAKCNRLGEVKEF